MLKRVNIYILVITFLYGFSFYSNLYSEDNLNLEVLFGFNFSKINGGYIWQRPTLSSSNLNFGFNLGIGLTYKYASFMDLNPQLELIKKGSKWGIPVIPFLYDSDYIIYEISYIQLSFNHLVHICTSESRKIDLLLGIYGAYELSAEEEWIFENKPEDGLPIGNLEDYISDYDFGLSLGLKIISIKKRCSFLFRYDHGMKSINKTEDKRASTDFYNKSSQMMRSLLITLSINFKSFN